MTFEVSTCITTVIWVAGWPSGRPIAMNNITMQEVLGSNADRRQNLNDGQ